VRAGDLLARLHASTADQAAAAAARLREAFAFSARPVTPPPLVAEVITC